MFYRLSFGSADSVSNDIGVGSALGVIIFLIVGVGAAVGSNLMRRREVEQ
jgi:ABC-type sugar transport system permease subunit